MKNKNKDHMKINVKDLFELKDSTFLYLVTAFLIIYEKEIDIITYRII